MPRRLGAKEYKAFVKESGGPGGYLNLCSVYALDLQEALVMARRTLAWGGRKVVVVPCSRKDLYPHPVTGKLPRETMAMQKGLK